MQLLATVLQPPISLLPVLPHGLAAIAIATGYQLLLSRAGLRDFIIYGPAGDYSRDGLLSANREGIISCLGHLAMFFAGVEIGKQFFNAKRLTIQLVGINKLLIFLLEMVVGLWIS